VCVGRESANLQNDCSGLIDPTLRVIAALYITLECREGSETPVEKPSAVEKGELKLAPSVERVPTCGVLDDGPHCGHEGGDFFDWNIHVVLCVWYLLSVTYIIYHISGYCTGLFS